MNENSEAGHVFRSRLLDKFAGIESWAIACMAEGKKPTPNAPLGQKIEALSQLCAKSPPLFKSAKKISERLERLKPYQQLRATIVHSQLETMANAKGQISYCFHNAAQSDAPGCYRPVLLTPKECEDILREVSKIGNELRQLTTKPSQLSSPPPPLQAATDGP
jgi:hypothetical protein